MPRPGGRVRRLTLRCASTCALALLGALLPGTAAAQAQTAQAQTAQARGAAVSAARQGTVHTDTLWSQSLGIRKSLVVYLPPSYASSPTRRYPVLVYLHGLSGNERNWSEQGALPRTMDSLVAAGHPEAIIVMPDGDDGWYTTWNLLVDAAACRADTVRREPARSYCVPWPHYDDYIARDIVAHVDRRYRSRATREARAIAGLSMGGYGAVTLALAYPDVFSAAASHSGVLSPRLLAPKPYPAGDTVPSNVRYATDTAGMRAAGGSLARWLAAPFGRDTIGWQAREPAAMAARLVARARSAPRSTPPSATSATRSTTAATRPELPALLIDCGVDDTYLPQNRDLHARLTAMGFPHRYAEWSGRHDWNYWRTHAAESLVFLLARTAPARARGS